MRHPGAVLALKLDVSRGCSLKTAAWKWGQKAEVMDLEKADFLTGKVVGRIVLKASRRGEGKGRGLYFQGFF